MVDGEDAVDVAMEAGEKVEDGFVEVVEPGAHFGLKQ